jgi:hypothetical protein
VVNRSIIHLISCIAVACAVVAPATVSFADDAPPSAADMAAAKKAYGEGKALHDKGNLADAVEKFKESYRLSKNPLLLYNIAFTMDEAGTKDLALFYYKKFLTDAPPDATQRATVTERVKVLDKEGAKPDAGDKKPEPKTEPKGNIKPAGTYSATDFAHQVVEEAPPGKPLDITASVPDDSGFVVTLYFRASGESNFTARVMKPRYKELVARIPAAKMAGTAIQYYVECKDAAGTVVTRSGKSTEPNLVTIEPTATAKFYPDLVDEAPPPPQVTGDNDDPLGVKKPVAQVDTNPVLTPHTDTPTHGGFTDAGSSKFTYAKWGTTAGAAVFLGVGVLFYVRAHNAADALAADSTECGTPPCRKFDTAYDADVQSGGKRDALFFDIGIGLGAATAVVAGYFWYKELQAKKSGDMKVSGTSSTPAASWAVSPMADGSTIGAAAVGRF